MRHIGRDFQLLFLSYQVGVSIDLKKKKISGIFLIFLKIHVLKKIRLHEHTNVLFMCPESGSSTAEPGRLDHPHWHYLLICVRARAFYILHTNIPKRSFIAFLPYNS